MVNLFESTILTIEQHSDRLRSFILSIPQDIKWDFLSGQYIDIAFLEQPTKFSGYSLTSIAHDKVISISVLKTFDYTSSHKMFELQVGEKVLVRGPAGDFTLDCNKVHFIVLIAGGIGVTPLISMFRTASIHPVVKQVKFFHSAKHLSELLFQSEFQQIEKEKEGMEYFCSVTQEPNSSVKKGRFSAQDVLTTIDQELLDKFHFFICGPGSMNKDFRPGLLNRGIKITHIHIESYYEP